MCVKLPRLCKVASVDDSVFYATLYSFWFLKPVETFTKILSTNARSKTAVARQHQGCELSQHSCHATRPQSIQCTSAKHFSNLNQTTLWHFIFFANSNNLEESFSNIFYATLSKFECVNLDLLL